MARLKRKPRKSNKAVPSFAAPSEFYEPCGCEDCKQRRLRSKQPVRLAKWATTPGYGKWNPKTETYEISPAGQTETDGAVDSDPKRVRMLENLAKARAAKRKKEVDNGN